MPTRRCLDRSMVLLGGRRRWRDQLAVIVALAGLGASVAAQEYRSDPVDPKAKVNGAAATICLRDAGRFAADRAKFDEFFNKYYFPAMTRTAPEELADLGKLRYELFTKFLWNTSNEQVQQALTEMAYLAMGRIVSANPPYHPAVRYNAILVIGKLDDQYAIDAGANRRPPKPLPKATKALTVVVDSATTSDRFPPPVILGALLGLERHAQFRGALSPDAASAMTAAALKLVTHDEPIQEMDRDEYAWLRLRAASVLAELGSVGPESKVHDALIKLIASGKSLDDRCSTAALLAKINYKDAQVDGKAAADASLTLASDVAAAEAKRAKEFEDAQIGVTPGGFIPGRGAGFVPGGQFGEVEQFPRRQVLARLTDLRTGLVALKPVVPADAQPKIDAIVAAIDPVITAAADKDTVELKVTAAIRAMADAINREAAPAEAPAAEAPAAEAEDGF